MTTFRTVTLDRASTDIEDGSKQWASEVQPWADRGIHIQYRRTTGDFGVYVATEAVDVNTGRLIASASHITLTYDQVRRALVDA